MLFDSLVSYLDVTGAVGASRASDLMPGVTKHSALPRGRFSSWKMSVNNEKKVVLLGREARQQDSNKHMKFISCLSDLHFNSCERKLMGTPVLLCSVLAPFVPPLYNKCWTAHGVFANTPWVVIFLAVIFFALAWTLYGPFVE